MSVQVNIHLDNCPVECMSGWAMSIRSTVRSSYCLVGLLSGQVTVQSGFSLVMLLSFGLKSIGLLFVGDMLSCKCLLG